MKYGKLPKKFKKQWIAALRSGKYEQGQGELYSSHENKYCCLGVACHVITGKNPPEVGVIQRGAGIRGINSIPKILVGNTDNNIVVDILASMNDGVRLTSGKKIKQSSFVKIANWIEKNL